MLTRREGDVLRVLARSLRETGVTPSLREIADELGLAGFANIKRYLDGLERKGFIRRLPGRARAIEILRDREAFVALHHPEIGTVLVRHDE